MATEAEQPLPVPVGAELDRRFEAFVFDWDGTAVPDRRADASGVRAAVERLCALGADVAVITGTHIGNVDPQLGARPAGPRPPLLLPHPRPPGYPPPAG